MVGNETQSFWIEILDADSEDFLKKALKISLKMGMVARTFDPSTLEPKADCCECQASQSYILRPCL